MYEVQAQEFISVDTHLYAVVFNSRCGHSPLYSDQKSNHPAAASRKETPISRPAVSRPLMLTKKKAR